jgi:hypothetical protein
MLFASALWLGTVVMFLVLLIEYSNSPGHSGAPPVRWPAQSRISLDPSRATLVLFAHPRCPCTRASLCELELLLACCPNQIIAHVVFIKPTGTEKDWTQTELWGKASAIPGVSVCEDDAGVEARRFHVETSGHTLLYDRDGRLLFRGGITIARGHAGDNPGRSAIVALLMGQASGGVITPVFGCPLLAAECQEGGVECKR